jgi:hypothetical protein
VFPRFIDFQPLLSLFPVPPFSSSSLLSPGARSSVSSRLYPSASVSSFSSSSSSSVDTVSFSGSSGSGGFFAGRGVPCFEEVAGTNSALKILPEVHEKGEEETKSEVPEMHSTTGFRCLL